MIESDINLTPKEKIFVQEYMYDWNSSRAARAAGYSIQNAFIIGHELVRKPKIKQYIKQMQNHLEKQLGISKMMVLHEHMKIAFSSVAYLHDTWMTMKEFEDLTNDQKACIQEIVSQTRKMKTEEGHTVSVDYVKIKLYDKQKALESLSKMLGYDSPMQINVKHEGEIIHKLRGVQNLLADLTPDEFNAIKKIGLPQLEQYAHSSN